MTGAAGMASGVGADDEPEGVESTLAWADESVAPASRLVNVSVLTANAAVAVPRTPTTVRTERSCVFMI